MVARSRDGSTKAFPVVETIHRNSILLVTEAPAHVPEELRQRAQEVAESAVACLDGMLHPAHGWRHLYIWVDMSYTAITPC